MGDGVGQRQIGEGAQRQIGDGECVRQSIADAGRRFIDRLYDGGREQKQGGCRVAGDGVSAIGNARGVVELIDDRHMIAPFFTPIV